MLFNLLCVLSASLQSAEIDCALACSCIYFFERPVADPMESKVPYKSKATLILSSMMLRNAFSSTRVNNKRFGPSKERGLKSDVSIPERGKIALLNSPSLVLDTKPRSYSEIESQ